MARQNKQAKLVVENAGYAHNDRWLFRRLSFVVQPGQLLQVSGANGSGKTTLLRVMAGLLPLHEGTKPSLDPASFHYLGHQAGVRATLSVHENIEWFIALAAAKPSKTIAAVLAQVNLTAQQRQLARCLSAGQLRRLALARLLLSAAPLWLLDEPGNSLDAGGIVLLQTLMQQHLGTQGMLILVSHQTLGLAPASQIQLGNTACVE